MKIPTLLLALGSLLSTSQAQQAPAKPHTARAHAAMAEAPAKPQAARAHAVVAANSKAIGRQFITKSKPTDRLIPVPISRPEVIVRPD